MPRATGFPDADARDDFLRARRGETYRRLGRALSGRSELNVILPFDEVVAALGRVGERDLGLRVIALDSIVGTVDRRSGFDRSFRPTSGDVRVRWERIANMMRRGEALPPISVYRIGEVHFVRDGHHRVSVARALGRTDIQARVVEVRTRVGATRALRMEDLPLKGHERLFHERVPLRPDARARVRLSNPWAYADLAEGVEAWGFRHTQARRELLDRHEVAQAWFNLEYLPVLAMLRDAGMLRDAATEGDAFMRVACERYRLLRSHDWSDEVLARLREAGL